MSGGNNDQIEHGKPTAKPKTITPRGTSIKNRPIKPTTAKPRGSSDNLPKVTTGGSARDQRSGTADKNSQSVNPRRGVNPAVNDPKVVAPRNFNDRQSTRKNRGVVNDPKVIDHRGNRAGTRSNFDKGSGRARQGFGESSLDGVGTKRIHRPISHSSCGHSVCGSRSSCVYGSSYHGGYRGHYRDPRAYGYCAPVRDRWHHDHDDHWNVSFGFHTGGVSLGYGYSSGWSHDPSYYSGHYYPRYSYGYRHYPSSSWTFGYSSVYEDPCWDPCDRIVYYRPVYGHYRPRYSCYRPYGYGGYYSGGYSSVSYTYLFEDDDDDVEPYSTYDAVPQWSESEAADGYTGSSGEVTVIAPNDGWELLSQGDAREARRSFDRAREAFPSDGLPRVGYAIASGLVDRADEAVSEMRRVLREDPDALDEVPQDEALMVEVQRLIDAMNVRFQDSNDDVDALFMMASLRYVMDEDARAYLAIDIALDRGDRDRSATQLKSMIQSSIENEGQIEGQRENLIEDQIEGQIETQDDPDPVDFVPPWENDKQVPATVPVVPEPQQTKSEILA